MTADKIIMLPAAWMSNVGLYILTRRRVVLIENISDFGFKCVSLNARLIVNKESVLNIMVRNINPHIIDINESWVNKDVSDVELGLT